MNERSLLAVIVDVPDIHQATFGELPRETDAAVRQLYGIHSVDGAAAEG